MHDFYHERLIEYPFKKKPQLIFFVSHLKTSTSYNWDLRCFQVHKADEIYALNPINIEVLSLKNNET